MSNRTGADIPNEMIATVRAVADALFKSENAPCLDRRAGEASRPGSTCVQRLTIDKRTPWHKLNPDEMCATCAAYWHTTSAAQHLETAKRTGSHHGL